MATYYTTYGGVRGTCGHRHRTATSALVCLEGDSAACHRQGGYSDRLVVRVPDGTPPGDLTDQGIAQSEMYDEDQRENRPQYLTEYDVELGHS